MKNDALKMYLTVFGTSAILFLIMEVLYYQLLPISPEMSKVGFSFGMMAFVVLGALATIVSFGLYRRIRAKEEVSMVTFFLNPGKLVREVRLIHYASVIGGAGWAIYSFTASIYFGYLRIPGIDKGTAEILSEVYLFASLLFAVTCVLVFNRWRRRFKAYV